MPSQFLKFGVVVVLAGGAGHAAAGVTYLTQDRAISAATSADGNSQTIAAPDFASFVQSLNLSATFQTAGGGPGSNKAQAGIDCQLDPNAIFVNGLLAGAGGASVTNGRPGLEIGEASLNVNLTFRLDSATPFSLFALARPSTRAGDRFKIKLRDETHGITLAFIDEKSAPQDLNITGDFLAGDFSLEYQVEQRIDGDETAKDLSLQLRIPTPSSVAVLGVAGLLTGRRRR